MSVIFLKFCFENIFHEFIKREIKKMKHPVEIPTPAKSEIFICGFYGIIFIKVCCWFQMSIPIPKRNEFLKKESTIHFYFLLD